MTSLRVQFQSVFRVLRLNNKDCVQCVQLLTATPFTLIPLIVRIRVKSDGQNDFLFKSITFLHMFPYGEVQDVFLESFSEELYMNT